MILEKAALYVLCFCRNFASEIEYIKSAISRNLSFQALKTKYICIGVDMGEANEVVASALQRCHGHPRWEFCTWFMHCFLKSFWTILWSHILMSSEASHMLFQNNAKLMCKYVKGARQQL